MACGASPSLTEPRGHGPQSSRSRGSACLAGLARAPVPRCRHPAFPRTRHAPCQLRGFRADTSDVFKHPWGVSRGGQEDDGMKKASGRGRAPLSPFGFRPERPVLTRPFLRSLAKVPPVSFLPCHLGPLTPYPTCVCFKTAVSTRQKARSTQTCAAHPCTSD